MKTQILNRRELRNEAKKAVLSAAVVALFAGLSGCGQSRVDYQRTDEVVRPIVQPVRVETVPVEASDYDEVMPWPAGRIRYVGLDDASVGAYSWQTWGNANATNVSSVGSFDLSGNIRLPQENETLYEFGNIRRAERCVFRNRLLTDAAILGSRYRLQTSSMSSASSDDRFGTRSSGLPRPFGDQDLLCVDNQAIINSMVRVGATRSPRRPEEGVDFVEIRVLGLRGSYRIPVTGTHNLDFRSTARIGLNQNFYGFALTAQEDGMANLLNAYHSSQLGNAAGCGLERSFVVRLTVENGAPRSVTLLSKTRNVSIRQFERSMSGNQASILDYDRGSNSDVVTINREGINACRAQHLAWLRCLRMNDEVPNRGRVCDDAVVRLAERNFGGLLNFRAAQALPSNRMFVETRLMARRRNENAVVWYNPEASQALDQYNPLSLEDFQEMTDVTVLDRLM